VTWHLHIKAPTEDHTGTRELLPMCSVSPRLQLSESKTIRPGTVHIWLECLQSGAQQGAWKDTTRCCK
jgi:hypothetical protein